MVIASKSCNHGRAVLDEDEMAAVLWFGKFILSHLNMEDGMKSMAMSYDLPHDTDLSQRSKDIIKLLMEW